MPTKHHMKKTCPVIEQLPVPWRRLFLTLSSPRFAVEKATIWYRESTESRYGHNPAWSDVLTSLLVMNPYVDNHSASLLFKPRLLLLQPTVQELFMEFFLQESHLVPDTEIRHFVKGLVTHVSTDSKLYDMLRKLHRTTKESDTSPTEDIFKQTLDEKRPLQGVEVNHVVSSIEHNISDKPLVVREDKTIITPEHSDDIAIDIIVLDDDDDGELDIEPAAKRQKLDLDKKLKEKYNESDINISRLVEKTLNKSEENTIVNTNTNGDKHIADLVYFSQEKEDTLTQLKDLWRNSVTQPDASLMQTLSTFSPEEMKAACNRLNMVTMPEASIATACEHLVTVSDSLSYDSCCCFLTFTLGIKVKELAQNASQILMGVVILIAETFPKQLIDSVLIPVITEVPTVPQCELVCRVIKDVFAPGNRNHLIQKMLSASFDTNDGVILVLQGLVDNPSGLTDAMLLKLMTQMEASSIESRNNLKFGKLLLGVVNKHGKLMSSASVAKLANIVDRHETFLKKSIENGVKKLKPV